LFISAVAKPGVKSLLAGEVGTGPGTGQLVCTAHQLTYRLAIAHSSALSVASLSSAVADRHNNIRDDSSAVAISAKVNRMVGSSSKAALGDAKRRECGLLGHPSKWHNAVASGPGRVADGRRN